MPLTVFRRSLLVLGLCFSAATILPGHGAESAPVQDARRPPRPGDEGVFHGPLISVADGDSFRARIQGVGMEFRLYAIDAPERDQAYAKQSREALQSLLGKHELVMVFIDIDRYGRIIADVWADGVHVNRELVARGAAHFYPEYARDNALYEVEQEARDAKRGLWGLPLAQRESPWVWREHKRTPKPSGAQQK
jgi:endonuclease YncB( thermonuclease family)